MAQRMTLVNESKVEQLKVFYALFTTIMDSEEYDMITRLDKLQQLRVELRKVAPDDVH